jgi:hypothetical protein
MLKSASAPNFGLLSSELHEASTQARTGSKGNEDRIGSKVDTRSDSSESSRKGSKEIRVTKAVAPLNRTLTVQYPELQLIRREANIDIASASPIGDNSTRLVQGAAATRDTYKQIRQKMMADNSISSHKAPVYDFQTQMAALHTVRKRILDVHSSIYDIFSEGDMDKREWCTILSKSKFCTLIEARAVFDVLDANGMVT